MLKDNAYHASQNAEYYDKLWAEDDRTPEEMAPPGSFGDARIQFIIGCLQRVKSNSVPDILDLGCGSGWIETFISDYGNITAIDFSPQTIQLAQKKYGDHAKFLVAQPDAPFLGLPETQKFDIVLSSEVIEHVYDQASFVRQIASFLKPNGYCILTTPNGAVWEAYKNDDRYRRWHQPIENWLTASECANLFRQAGFRVLSHKGWVSQMYIYNFFSQIFMRPKVQKFVQISGIQHMMNRLLLHYGFLQLLLVQKK